MGPRPLQRLSPSAAPEPRECVREWAQAHGGLVLAVRPVASTRAGVTEVGPIVPAPHARDDDERSRESAARYADSGWLMLPLGAEELRFV